MLTVQIMNASVQMLLTCAVLGDAGRSGGGYEGGGCSCNDGTGGNSCSVSSSLCTAAFANIFSSVVWYIWIVMVCVSIVITAEIWLIL